jgi:hypothetical protein
LAIISFIIVPKANFESFRIRQQRVRKIAHNRPTKLTLSSTLLQSSHNNYEKRDILGKNINSVSSQPNIEVLAKKMKK